MNTPEDTLHDNWLDSLLERVVVNEKVIDCEECGTQHPVDECPDDEADYYDALEDSDAGDY